MPETRLPLRRWCAHTHCTHTLYIIHGTLSSLLLLATLEGKHTNTHNLRRGFYRFNLTVSVHSAEKQTSVERKESIICHVSVSSVCVRERERHRTDCQKRKTEQIGMDSVVTPSLDCFLKHLSPLLLSDCHGYLYTCHVQTYTHSYAVLK